MSGHSKWSKVKHYKGVLDAKRGKVFSKLAKEIAVACKHGGGDPGFNPRLRTILMKARAVEHARRQHRPRHQERHRRTRRRQLRGSHLRRLRPGGVALLVDVLTDNKNRTASEIRMIFTKHGGTWPAPARSNICSIAKARSSSPKEQIAEDDLMTLVLDAGAEDMTTDDTSYDDYHRPAPVRAGP